MSHNLPENLQIANADKLFINSEWVAPLSERFIELVSPDTEEEIGRVAEADEADMDRAVAAAREAFDQGPWPRMSVEERAGYLVKMTEYLSGRMPELVEAHRVQVGALPAFAAPVAGGAVQAYAGYSQIGQGFPWVSSQPSIVPGNTAMVVREPVGVCACIAPWNTPFAIMAGKTAPALIAGCTVVMKPSPETPLEAYIIAEAAEAVGLPPGVVNLVTGQRAASDYLVRSPGVDKIAFTGSTAAGKRIASVAGERIARVTLELGGKSAAIIADDFPIEQAGAMLARTIAMNSGQICAMLSRAIVPAHRHDALRDAIAAEMKKIKVGHSYDSSSEMGPIAMKRQLDSIENHIAKGKQEGAALAAGGGRPAGLNKGYFIEPTLFANVDNAMTIAQEEIFGPVLCLIPARDEAHAVEIANDSNYGLSGSVFTNDADKFTHIGRQIRTGYLVQNGLKMDFSVPFGGFKQSGLGREGGPEGLYPYLETKSMIVEKAPA